MSTPLPHPGTGEPFGSPVPPGSGWPEDPAAPRTRVARDAAAVARLAGSARTLAALDARVSVCRACPRLVAWREAVAATKRAAFAGEPYWGRPVPGFGADAPHGLIVGLAPAANGANRTGRMFTGDRSGAWLYASLHRVGVADRPASRHAGDGLYLDGVRITSPVHCAPPANVPTTTEKATCSAWLDREIELVAGGLSVIVALGGIAWTQTLGAARRLRWAVPRPAPRFGHGAEATLHTPDGRAITLLGCYHVSQRNTQTGLLTEPMLDAVLARLRPGPGLRCEDRAATPGPRRSKESGMGRKDDELREERTDQFEERQKERDATFEETDGGRPERGSQDERRHEGDNDH